MQKHSFIVLKSTAGQQSLTIVTVFVTAEKLHRTVNMTTYTIDVTTIFINLILKQSCHRQVN